jgi:branched-chain amino acid transport system substrate-binding protein
VVHAEIEKHVYGKGKGIGEKDKIGEVLYNRGLVNAMLGVEAIRTAQGKFGKKPLTGEQVRWGYENLNLTADRIKEMGFEGMLKPIKITCADHEGAREGRVQQWDGKAWKIISDWYTANQEVTEPLVKEVSEKYSKEKNITPRDCSKES